MCLIEANQPVSLPDVVCQMRDQRPMLIQTAVTPAFFTVVVAWWSNDYSVRLETESFWVELPLVLILGNNVRHTFCTHEPLSVSIVIW